ncbi:MAG TPA: polysaccharide deacetylase family protein [Usitatibacter sp.]|nr:polysaccharide deacetylase family protein [Usitatibacter sp.]
MSGTGSRGFILTFHSHNVSGDTYATNDHVALDATLTTLERLRIPVLRLVDVARRLRAKNFDSLPPRFACITFDDGSDYDWRDAEFPGHGVQRSMFSILRSHSRSLLGLAWLRRARATSFVIASARARDEIAAAALGDAALMSDAWWAGAQRSGLMDIGTHGWNHVHPAVSEMASRPELVEHFERIESPEDARLQVDRAFESIQASAGGDAGRIFAYPYGQVSDFVADRHLPSHGGIVAAVAVEPRPVTASSDPWRMPRYVCGPHWSSDEELEKLLAAPH